MQILSADGLVVAETKNRSVTVTFTFSSTLELSEGKIGFVAVSNSGRYVSIAKQREPTLQIFSLDLNLSTWLEECTIILPGVSAMQWYEEAIVPELIITLKSGRVCRLFCWSNGWELCDL